MPCGGGPHHFEDILGQPDADDDWQQYRRKHSGEEAPDEGNQGDQRLENEQDENRAGRVREPAADLAKCLYREVKGDLAYADHPAADVGRLPRELAQHALYLRAAVKVVDEPFVGARLPALCIKAKETLPLILRQHVLDRFVYGLIHCRFPFQTPRLGTRLGRAVLFVEDASIIAHLSTGEREKDIRGYQKFNGGIKAIAPIPPSISISALMSVDTRQPQTAQQQEPEVSIAFRL